MTIKIRLNKITENYIIISKTYSYFTLKAFNSLKILIKKNKKLCTVVKFKKIPQGNTNLYIKPFDPILELSDLSCTGSILKVLASKLPFQIQLIKLIYLK